MMQIISMITSGVLSISLSQSQFFCRFMWLCQSLMYIFAGKAYELKSVSTSADACTVLQANF